MCRYNWIYNSVCVFGYDIWIDKMAEEPAANTTSTEKPVEEPPAEELVVNTTSTEKPVEEPPAEEVVVNTTSTEKPVEEPPAEEVVVNTTSTEKPVEEPPAEEVKSHLFAIRTTGGQEKVVMRLLETKAKMNKINIQSVLWVNNLKGYVVIEALDPSAAYQAIEGIRHIRGQLRGELEFKDIEGYLIKKSMVAQLAVDQTVEITGGPFKGMKATITRVDHEKEEATVVLLEASYQLPVTVDANYLKISVGFGSKD